jgi:hypothetical protein
MTSQEPDPVHQDLFAAEVQLFQADVDLALRSGLVLPAPAPRPQEIEDRLPADLGQWP